ncbi:MAG: hypothetical protein LC623_02150, partial [Halobacteriales archaeon]|nr:hypothetical protein [Halobacteriales archaeon]
PRAYTAALLGSDDHTARFVFRAADARDNFTLTMFRDSPTGSVVLARMVTNETTLAVPYAPGESVKISVTDPHGWQNTQNAVADASGFTSYPPYTWNPDYKQISNYQRHSWIEEGTAGFVLILGFLALIFVQRRRRA